MTPFWVDQRSDHYNHRNCIHYLETFDHRNHICIVTQLLGQCLYDFLKENQFTPFPRRHIQDFARSLLDSVACECTLPPLFARTNLYAVLHDLQLIHTDLKPENILLVDSSYETRPMPPGLGRVSTRSADDDCVCAETSRQRGSPGIPYGTLLSDSSISDPLRFPTNIIPL